MLRSGIGGHDVDAVAVVDGHMGLRCILKSLTASARLAAWSSKSIRVPMVRRLLLSCRQIFCGIERIDEAVDDKGGGDDRIFGR
jgi:hypothetical protein